VPVHLLRLTRLAELKTSIINTFVVRPGVLQALVDVWRSHTVLYKAQEIPYRAPPKPVSMHSHPRTSPHHLHRFELAWSDAITV